MRIPLRDYAPEVARQGVLARNGRLDASPGKVTRVPMTLYRIARAFLLGIAEHSSDLTTHYDYDEPGADAYERGRYLAWRIRGWEV